MRRNRKVARLLSARVVICLTVPVFSAACLSQPSRTLTFEEELQLREQRERIYQLPRDRQALAEKQVECNRERLEAKGQKSDFFDVLFSDKESKCDPIPPAHGTNAAAGDPAALDAVIDRNLKDALDRTKNQK